eukprot:scaffold11247_cov28-Tisochrysis_lutea.AAC.3
MARLMRVACSPTLPARTALSDSIDLDPNPHPTWRWRAWSEQRSLWPFGNALVRTCRHQYGMARASFRHTRSSFAIRSWSANPTTDGFEQT